VTDAAPEARRRPGETLRAGGVSRSFEGVRALDGVTLELHRHEVVGLIGPNGAGKTTLVNIVTGFDFPDEGGVELAGEEITSWPPHRRARQGLARTYQHGRLFGGLSEAEVPGFAEVVRRVRDEHEAGVLLIDHNVGLVLDVCDRVQVLDEGRTLAEGTPAEIRRNIDVTAAYLGRAHA